MKSPCHSAEMVPKDSYPTCCPICGRWFMKKDLQKGFDALDDFFDSVFTRKQ